VSLGLIALVGVLAATPASARRAHRDSSTVGGSRVQISSQGVVIETNDAADSRFRIEAGDSGRRLPSVVVLGPHLKVDDEGQLVRVFADAFVPEGEQVDGDVVTIFGSSRIEGHVSGNAIAVFGSVRIAPHAAVDGDMVAIFGAVHREEGSTVGGEIVDLAFAPPIPGLPALPTILLFVAMFWVFQLIGGWIVTLIMPDRLVRITATASQRMGGSLLLGLASLPLLITTVGLLCITVIGIPIAILMPIAFGVSAWIGQYAGLYGLGLKLLRRRLGQGSVFQALAVGTLFVAVFFAASALFAGPAGLVRTLALFLVCVGGLILFALQIIGVGAVLLSRFGTRPRELAPAAEPVPVLATPPAAPPVSA
jgi:hypothetical protein